MIFNILKNIFIIKLFLKRFAGIIIPANLKV